MRDLIPDLKAATNGYVVDKVEGFAIDADGNAFVVTDNDGVDDSSGETLFLRLGNIAPSTEQTKRAALAGSGNTFARPFKRMTCNRWPGQNGPGVGYGINWPPFTSITWPVM